MSRSTERVRDKEAVVHYSIWVNYIGIPKIECVGNWGIHAMRSTSIRLKVTCKNCRRTRVFREAQRGTAP